MAANPFRVTVTGDTGYNIYTEYVKGYEDDRVHRPEYAHDVEVPAGAEFGAEAFKALLSHEPRISVEHLLPAAAKSPAQPNFSTFVKFLVELGRFPARPPQTARVLRNKSMRPIHDKYKVSGPEVFHELVSAGSAGQTKRPADLLVIHDGAGNWRKYPREKHKKSRSPASIDALALLEGVLARPTPPSKAVSRSMTEGSAWPRVIINLTQDLPAVVYSPKTEDFHFHDELTVWHTLMAHAENVCVVCSLDTLRQDGAAVSRRLSWEQTIEDLAMDLRLYDKLRVLARFRHLILRVGVVGAVHIQSSGPHRSMDVVFAPLAKAGIYRDQEEDGDVDGLNVLMCASLAQMIAKRRSPPHRPDFVRAMTTAVAAGMRVFDAGYQVDWMNVDESAGRRFVKDLYTTSPAAGCPSAAQVLAQPYNEPLGDDHDRTLGWFAVPADIVDPPPAGRPPHQPPWEILRNAISPIRSASSTEIEASDTLEISRINVGAAIVEFGHEAVLNRTWTDQDSTRMKSVLARPACVTSPEETRDFKTLPRGRKPNLPTAPTPLGQSQCMPNNCPSIFVPVLSFGALTLIERLEIESLRSIRNLLKTYHEQTRRGIVRAPVSVAVFGPPGSGKSYAVKEIARDINATLSEPHRGFEAVEYNVAQFRSVDELGEAITRASVINNEGKIPLIFFDEFDCEFGGPLGWLKYFLSPMQDGAFYGVKQPIRIARAVFVFAGGTYHTFQDFDPAARSNGPESEGSEARMRVFREQKGPDFVSRLRGHINILPVNVTPGETKPIIRRSVILRNLMDRVGLVIKVRGQRIAYIDPDVLYALLTIDNYRHGARSMEAILNMCSPMNHKIEKASLPSRAQMNMHVDADEFFIRMYRGRFRPPSPPAELIVQRGVRETPADSDSAEPTPLVSPPSSVERQGVRGTPRRKRSSGKGEPTRATAVR